MIRPGAVSAALIAALLALGACDSGDPADAAAPSDPGSEVALARGPGGQLCVNCPVTSSHILFTKWSNSTHGDIYAMNPDGTGRKAIVAEDVDEFDPAWSPTYSRIAFIRRTEGPLGSQVNGIWSAGYDGLQQFRITQDYRDLGPAWGKTNRIAFYSMRESQAALTNEIFTINPDGTGVLRLTNSSAEDHNPAWSPDGTKIVFASDRGPLRARGAMHLWVMNADGTGQTQLTFGSGEDEPAWSPDGTRIAYTVVFGGQPFAVWAMNANGTNASALATGFLPAPGGWVEFHPGQPTWSPDSKRIAFSSDLSGQYGLYSIAATGGAVTSLNSIAQEKAPAWSY
jgi:Tol biopolymer transport system component